MKKPINRNSLENSSILVNAFLEEPAVLQRLVERLAHHSSHHRFSECQFGDWEPVQFSSLEGYANGGLILSDKKELMNSLFDTCFLFTCTRERKRNNRLTWVCSLS